MRIPSLTTKKVPKDTGVYADLHIHSIHSDGLLSPSEIINMCQESGIKKFALTDHDSVSGIKHATDIRHQKIEVIPGVEMSSNLKDLDIHLLAYYIDFEDSSLISYFEDFQWHRQQRVKKFVEKLHLDGVKLDFEHIKITAQDGSMGRPHIAKALMEKGYVGSMNEAFTRYLGYHTPYYVPKKNIHPKEAMKKIKKWHGIPVVAHPAVLNSEDLIIHLVELGAMGLEIWHPDNSVKWQNRLYEIAAKGKLIMTGGSDFHGFQGKYGQFGKFGCGKKEVDRLKRLAYCR